MRTTTRATRVLALLLLASCQRTPPGGLARVVQFAPGKAEVGQDDLVGGIRVGFDRPVAAEGAAGQLVAGPALSIEPAVEGEARWLDRQTLAFFPRRPLQPSTAYQVSIARGLAVAPQTKVSTWSGARFVYQRIEIESLNVEGPRKFQPRTPVVTVRASLPVKPADAIAGCAFFPRQADGKLGAKVKARAAEGRADDEDSSQGRQVRLAPVDTLAAGADYAFRCDGGFKPAGGGEGLAKERDLRFTTLGDAAVKSIGPAGHDVSADEVKLQIVFSTPMDPAQVRQHAHLTSNGAVVPIELAGDATATTFSWTGDLDPGSSYDVTVDAGLQDAQGQTVKVIDHHFTVGDASPRLRMEHGIFVVERASGRYPIWTRNLGTFHVACAAIPESKLAAVLTGPANYDSWWDAAQGTPDYQKLGLTMREHDIPVAQAKNTWADVGLPLRQRCGGGASGVYLLEVTSKAPDPRWQRHASLASVTDLGLLSKVGNASSLVWVVRLSTGEPVAGATVKIRDLTGKVQFTGKSNGDGVVLAPGASKLLGVKPTSDEEGEWDEWRARRVIVTAQAGDDLAVLDTNWNNGIQIWNYSVPRDTGGGATRVRGFLHSDRGLYRPGDTVHLRGIVRRIDVAGRMTVPKQRRIHVSISDPKGSTIAEQDLPVSGFGGFFRDLDLPAEAPLGDYRVQGELEGQKFSERFSVEEFRPRTFEVKIATPKKNVVIGQPLRFTLTGNYLYGSPLRQAKVTWNVRRRAHLPQFAGFEEYSFQDEAALWASGRYWAAYEERSFSDPVGDGELTLDEQGRGTVVAHDADKNPGGPQDYLFEASVADTTGATVVTTEVVSGHRSNLYLGVHPSEWVQAVDMPFGVQVVGFDAEGKRRTASATLTLTRREYECGGGYYSYACKPKSVAPAITRTVSVPQAGSAAVERVTLREPGEYLVEVKASDGQGHDAVANQTVYVIGKGEAFWSGDEGDRLTVIASKRKYRPGDTALLVPQAQMPGALALLTLERDGILSYRTQKLASTGEALSVPIDAKLAPNVFASVALVRGRTGAGDAARPRFRMGVVDLVVDSDAKRLNVAVETERPSYEPGDLVKAKVKVTDATGAPVKGELALAVADEGVLQIVGFKTPDPLPVFYAPWGLGVEAATTWNRLLRGLRPDEDDGEEGGDGGGDEAGRIRSRFMATAFWAPALVTDGTGSVAVSFRAPDNLTAFRVMAVVADGGDRFGAGEQRFTVRKPLQAVPALPRFLSVGDHFRASVVVHNNTPRTLSVVVNATVTGPVGLSGDSSKTVSVKAGNLLPVTFEATARSPGEARFVFRATGGDLKDAVEARLPVESTGTPDVLLVGEGAAGGRIERQIPALGQIVAGRGALDVSLDATGMGRLEEGLRYLVGYPYGCLEQTTSKMVPMIALTDLAKVVELKEVPADKARGFVKAGIAKVLRHQHDDGGFGLWPGTPAEVHYTAYGLWGLQVAKSAGYDVDGVAIDKGVHYLREHLKEESGAPGEMIGRNGAQAFALYVLSTLGQPDEGRMAQLYEHRAQLPIYGRAFLARALQAGKQPELASALAKELAALTPHAGLAIIREGQRDLDWYWSSDERTTALVLSALLEIAPKDPAVPLLAEGLLAARVDGRWATTQENLYGVLALVQLGKARVAAEAKATVSLGGQVIARETLGGKVIHVRVPIEKLGRGALVIDGTGDFFWAARVHVERPMDAPHADHGLTVSRTYVDPDSGAELKNLKVGQLARVKVIVSSGDRQAHVAVVDRFPAGVEPVLTRFTPNMREDSAPRRPLWWESYQTTWQQQELHDDRAAVFADVLAPGQSTHEYLVRAVAAGTYAVPPATVEAMYRPQVHGQSAGATLEVLP